MVFFSISDGLVIYNASRFFHVMRKFTAIAGIMLVGALAVTTTTHSVYAWTNANGDFKGGIRHPGT